MSLRTYALAAMVALLSGCEADRFTSEQQQLEFTRFDSVRTETSRKYFVLPESLQFRAVKSAIESVGNEKIGYESFSLEKGHWKIVIAGMNNPSGLPFGKKPSDVQNEHDNAIHKLKSFITANNINAQIYFMQLDPMQMKLEETIPILYPNGSNCGMFFFTCVDKYVYVTHPKNDLRSIMWWLSHENIGDYPEVRKRLNEGTKLDFWLPSVFVLDEENRIVADVSAMDGTPIASNSKFNQERRPGAVSDYSVAINLISALELDWEQALTKWEDELMNPSLSYARPCNADCLGFNTIPKYKYTLPPYLKAKESVEATVKEFGAALKDAYEERGNHLIDLSNP